jgi:hypothetical protein
MWPFTGVPRPVDDLLSPCKPLFRGAHARPLVIFCWLWVGSSRDPGAGMLQGGVPLGLRI